MKDSIAAAYSLLYCPGYCPTLRSIKHSLHDGIGKVNTQPALLSGIYMGSDMPLRLNSGKLFVISPIFESWNIDSAGNKAYLPTVSGGLTPIAQLPLVKDKWAVQFGVIPRYNSEGLQINGTSFQVEELLLPTI